MNKKTNNPFDQIVNGFQYDESSTEETKNELSELGYNVDKFIVNIEATVADLSKTSRLSWMKDGEAIQQKLDNSLNRISSWSQKSVESIEQAFQEVMIACLNSPTPKFQAAFRNAKELTTESKAALLDELQALEDLNSKEGNEQNESST